MNRTRPALIFAAAAAALGGFGGIGGGVEPLNPSVDVVRVPGADRTAPATVHRAPNVSKFVRFFARTPHKRRRTFKGLGHTVAEGKRRARKSRNRVRNKRAHGMKS